MTVGTAAPSRSQPAASPSGCPVCFGSATYDLVHPAPLDFDVLEVLTVDLLGSPRKVANATGSS